MFRNKGYLWLVLCLLVIVASFPVSAQGRIDYESLEPEVGCPCWRLFVRQTRVPDVELDVQVGGYQLRSWLHRIAILQGVDLETEIGGWYYRQLMEAKS